ncbi:MAG: RNA methyltransferase [Paludibacteraceae bacterium]|nr:RNA methyltransferase [Paludibacteraceae bacterium]
MQQEFQMIAKTFKGLEDVLAQELIELGANDVQQDRRVVYFTGNKELMYKANLHLRTASRILKPICTFRANDTDDLYDKVHNLDWSQYISSNQSFAIDSTVYSETFNHSQFITYRVKDAIVDWYAEHNQKRPRISVSNPDIYLNIHISHDTCTLSLDSSGESLHKRGWRAEQTEAPINEALAAGMLLLAGWKGQCDLVDPFCGSGTILIEAAMIALGIPPGIYRSSFAFEHWQDFDRELFERLYNDESCEKEFTHHIYGSDISNFSIRIAEKNIKSAGLNKYISVEISDIKDLKPKTEKCLIVSNPPYGERLDIKNIMQLYSNIGEALKHRFAGSTAWIISSDERYLKNMGLKPTKRISLLNGALDCWFNKYELFEGKHSDYKKTQHNDKNNPKHNAKPIRNNRGRRERSKI